MCKGRGINTFPQIFSVFKRKLNSGIPSLCPRSCTEEWVVWHKTHMSLRPNRFHSTPAAECSPGVRVLHVHTSTQSPAVDAIHNTSGWKQGSFFSSEEMTQNANHWISMLGLVEHPGDEDGELLVNLTSMSDLVIQATFLSPSRQRLVWSRKASARNVQHRQLPTSFRFMIPNSFLCNLPALISNHVVIVFDVQQWMLV